MIIQVAIRREVILTWVSRAIHPTSNFSHKKERTIVSTVPKRLHPTILESPSRSYREQSRLKTSSTEPKASSNDDGKPPLWRSTSAPFTSVTFL